MSISSWELKTAILLFISCAKVVESVEDITSEVKYVRVSTPLWLSCSLQTKTLPSNLVSWYYNYQPVDDNDNTVVTKKGQSTLELNISTVALKDSGLYLCGYRVSDDSFIALKNYTVIIGDVPQPFRQQKCYKVGFPPKIYIWWSHHQAPYSVHNFTYTVFFCKPNITAFNICSKSISRLYKEYTSTESCTDMAVVADTSSNLFCNLTTVAERLFPYLYFKSFDVRSTILCSRIVAENIFGTYTSNRVCCKLLQNYKCTRPSNITVTAAAKRQLLVQWDAPDGFKYSNFVLYYSILYAARGDKQNRTVDVPSFKEQEILAYTLINLSPYTQYTVYIACGVSEFDEADQPAGPVTVRTLEEAPSSAPKLNSWKEVERNGTKLSVEIYWELPSKEFWNGKPERIDVEYWKMTSGDYLNETEIRNITVNNASAKSVIIRDLDLYTNYSTVVRLCTGGGCSDRSPPLIIAAQTTDLEDETEGHNYFLPIAVGLGVGLPLLLLALVIIGILIHRRRNVNPRAKPLSCIVDELKVSVDPYEQVSGQPPLVEEHSDYENDPPECQGVLAKKKGSSDHVSRESIIIDQNIVGSAPQTTRDEEERYVLLKKKSDP